MNLPVISGVPAGARARLERWLAGMRGPDGYGGPVVGPRGACLGYCGPGFDWRYEGLLDGWAALAAAAPGSPGPARIAEAAAELARAQLANGSFRCSYFDSNPHEGGMPHEPALVAALLRARAALLAAGLPPAAGLDAVAERFIEKRLLPELWNRALRTFNNWLQSDFDHYSPASVAAAAEALIGYGEAGADPARLEPYLAGAGESLLALQAGPGPLAGAFPVSSRRGSAVSPFLAARCLPALDRLGRRLNDDRYARAGDALADFLRAQARPDGGFPHAVFADRPAEPFPVGVGSAAGVLAALARTGRLSGAEAKPHLAFILGRQTPSGAFETAVGFGGRAGRAEPDWRDVLPVCGWADKVYHLLALAQPGEDEPGDEGEVRRAVTIRGRRGVFEESGRRLRLADASGNVWFDWEKRTTWPRTCLL